MTELVMWKLGIDMALVASLLYLSVRFLRSDRGGESSADLGGLESVLRGLVRDAERASKDLGEELSRKQRTLSELLFDLESVESRVNKAVNQAEDLKLALERRNRQEEVLGASSPPSRKEARRPVRETDRPHRQDERESWLAVDQEAHEPPSFLRSQQAALHVSSRSSQESARAEEPEFLESRTKREQGSDDAQPRSASRRPSPPSVEERTAPSGSEIRRAQARRVNVSMPQEAERSSPPRLAQQVEREVFATEQEVREEKALEAVFAKAEDLLRNGQTVQSVVASTRLSHAQVTKIEEIVKAEQPARSDRPLFRVSRSDERLGVLGGINRQTRTL